MFVFTNYNEVRKISFLIGYFSSFAEASSQKWLNDQPFVRKAKC